MCPPRSPPCSSHCGGCGGSAHAPRRPSREAPRSVAEGLEGGTIRGWKKRGLRGGQRNPPYKSARAEFRKSVEGMLPPGFLEHRRAARKEMLLAARSLIDHALKRMDDAGKA